MKVLVIGSGGREHAIVWKLSQSKSVDKIYCCPGNAGISGLAECINVKQDDFGALLDLVKYEWIDLTIVGPEDPLSKGIVDLFEKESRKILGRQRLLHSWNQARSFQKTHEILRHSYRGIPCLHLLSSC